MEIASVEGMLQAESELSGARTVAAAGDSRHGYRRRGQSGAWGYPNAVAEIVRALEPVRCSALTSLFRTE